MCIPDCCHIKRLSPHRRLKTGNFTVLSVNGGLLGKSFQTAKLMKNSSLEASAALVPNYCMYTSITALFPVQPFIQKTAFFLCKLSGKSDLAVSVVSTNFPESSGC